MHEQLSVFPSIILSFSNILIPSNYSKTSEWYSAFVSNWNSKKGISLCTEPQYVRTYMRTTNCFSSSLHALCIRTRNSTVATVITDFHEWVSDSFLISPGTDRRTTVQLLQPERRVATYEEEEECTIYVCTRTYRPGAIALRNFPFPFVFGDCAC